jgi:alpha-amylase
MMLDVVANHMGEGDISTFLPEPLNLETSYHPSCEINYDNQESIEQCEIANLPDLNTENPDVISTLNDWVAYMVEEYGFDGLRIDTVKHVAKDFWPDFAASSGVYTVGEVWDGSPDYLVGYADLMGGVLDYATYYLMNRFYQQTGSSQDLVDMINIVGEKFSNPAALATFLDNHDNPRWLSQKNDISLFKNALAFVILSRGIPIVYYGSEQAYAGGNDPANREDLWRSGFDTESDMYGAISRLGAARAAHGGLPGNDHVHLYVADTAYAWGRADGDLIVLTVNSGSGYDGEHCFNTQRPNGSWEDVYGSGTYTADGDGQVCVNVTNGEPVVLSVSLVKELAEEEPAEEEPAEEGDRRGRKGRKWNRYQ